MSQQVLRRTLSRAVAEAAAAVARVVERPPTPETLAAVHAVRWPVHDAESLRGLGLLEESRCSAEAAERLAADHARLFVGRPGRRPVAPADAPPETERSLRRLREEVAAAGIALPDASAPAAAQVLGTYAALLTAEVAARDAARWRRELVEDHLLTWVARCLSRVQLGAQTFLYQGVAVLGLALLRAVASAAGPSGVCDDR